MPDGPEYTFSKTGEPQEIVSKEDARELMAMREAARENGKTGDELPYYRLIVHSGRIRVDHSEGEVKNGRGDIAKPKQNYKLIPFAEGEQNGKGDSMHAVADKLPSSGDARIEVRLNRFFFEQEPANSIFTAGEVDTSDTPVSGDGEVQLGTNGSDDLADGSDFTNTASELPRAPTELTIFAEADGSFDLTVEYTNLNGDSTSVTFSSDASNEVNENVGVPVTSLGSVTVSATDTSGANSNTLTLNAKLA